MTGQDWSAWGGVPPCCCSRGNSSEDATTAEMDCPRHGNPGYGPENFIPPLHSGRPGPRCKNCGNVIDTRSWVQCCGSPR